MTNAFGSFLHTSPLSTLSSSTSLPPSPSHSLSSNCIRDYFGPIVQTVADCLISKGPLSISELVGYITQHCVRDWNVERGRLVDRLNCDVQRGKVRYYEGSMVRMNKARGGENAGYVTEGTHVRAALLVLLQHSLVSISGGKRGVADPTLPSTHYVYTFLVDRARLLPRYPRYVERVKSVVDENGGRLVEMLLCMGRMRVEDLVAGVWEEVMVAMDASDDGSDDGEGEKESNEEEPSMEEIEAFFNDEKPDKVTSKESKSTKDAAKKQALKDIVASLKKLTEAGFIEAVKPISSTREMIDLKDKEKELQDGIHGGEFEFDMDADGNIAASDKKKKRPRKSDNNNDRPHKKAKPQNPNELNDHGGPQCKPDNPTITSLLEPLRKLIPPGSVYRVNIGMCHASLRSMILGRLVQEFYGPQSYAKPTKDDEHFIHVGGIVTAALTYAARQEHAPVEQILGLEESEEDKHRRMAEWGVFTPADIAPYIPQEATKQLQSMVGGTVQNLSSLLIRMSQMRFPPIVVQVEEAGGHPSGGKFEICTRQLMQRLRDRIVHRIITTRHGLVAARIVSILQVKGHMESDTIAEDAMVPAKEARELLHQLHRDKYVNLFDMHMTKTHNSGTAIFLWNVIDERLLRAVIGDVQLAILHLRLRRQHEVEVGKEWMDRAKEAGVAEENVHEEDKKRHLKFCNGLERLDCALLQLDETLMVLKDL